MSTLLEKLIGSAALKDSICKCLRIKLKPGSVTTSKIADKAVTPAKLSDSVLTEVIQPSINTAKEELGRTISSIEGALETHASNTVKHITSSERSTWNNKQNALIFDNTPTADSNNPVKSGGIFNAITNAISNLSTLLTTKKISFNSNNSSDTDTGYVEGFVKINGSSREPGVHIKTNSTYSEGNSEISLVGSATPVATISAGEIHAYAGESASIFLTDADIDFNGNPATINSSDTLTITSDDGDLNFNGNHVKINGKDTGTYSQKMEIEELDASLNPTMAEVGHYYTFDNVVNTLSVGLTEDSTDTTHVQKILFFMTMGTSPDVTFSAAYGYHVYYDTDYELKTGSTYEVEALFNGTAWVIKSKEVYEPLFAGEFD